MFYENLKTNSLPKLTKIINQVLILIGLLITESVLNFKFTKFVRLNDFYKKVLIVINRLNDY